jgi:hydrogen peroxide-dependent heme synthase
MEPLEPKIGWGVLHLFYRVGATARDRGVATAEQVVRAVKALVAEGHGYQALVFSVLGHKADLGFMVLGPDLARLQRFQAELRATALEPLDSFVSLTELSEYTMDEHDERRRLEREGVTGADADAAITAFNERMAKYRHDRLYPNLPRKRTICFYPMAKKRDMGANWFALSFDDRKRLMAGHGKTGRAYAGRVQQLITGSTGLDDWEWGVTLLADDPVDTKDIVYEMRFDAASAEYAVFGPFWFGLLDDPERVLASVGLP